MEYRDIKDLDTFYFNIPPDCQERLDWAATRFKNKFPGLHEQAIRTLVGNGIGTRQEGENTVCPIKFVEYGNQEIALLVNGGTLLTIRLLPEESLKEIEKLVSDCPVYVINPADQLD